MNSVARPAARRLMVLRRATENRRACPVCPSQAGAVGFHRELALRFRGSFPQLPFPAPRISLHPIISDELYNIQNILSMIPPVLALWHFMSLSQGQAAQTFGDSWMGDYLCISDSLVAQLNPICFWSRWCSQLGCSEAGLRERVFLFLLLLLSEASREETPASPTWGHTQLLGTSSAKGKQSGCPLCGPTPHTCCPRERSP